MTLDPGTTKPGLGVAHATSIRAMWRSAERSTLRWVADVRRTLRGRDAEYRYAIENGDYDCRHDDEEDA